MMKKWTHSGSLKQELSAREEKHRALARRARKTQKAGEKGGGGRDRASEK